MNVCLFALTGFGNTVLAEMTKMPMIDNIVVFSRKERDRFPYYDCENLLAVCQRLHLYTYVDCDMNSPQVYEEINALSPDMIVVATFDQKVPKRIIDIPELGTINIHPSLLPEYRGPTPTHWVIINGEKETGVTFHLMSEDLDLGEILFQKKISIDRLVDGELRRKLAQLSAEMIEPFFKMYVSGQIKAEPQKEDEGSYYPRITSPEGLSILRSKSFPMENIVRGLTPYPGIEVLG